MIFLGQERYKSLAMNSISFSDGFLLVFAVNDWKSFEGLYQWIYSIEEKCELKKKVIIIVGNKIDSKRREVTNEEAFNFANSKNLLYFETSALTDFGIKEVFHKLFEETYKKYKELNYKEIEKLSNKIKRKIKTVMNSKLNKFINY